MAADGGVSMSLAVSKWERHQFLIEEGDGESF
jgi:hypothetical protein